MAVTVTARVQGDFPFPIRPLGDHRHTAFTRLPQGVGVIALVGDEMAWQAGIDEERRCGADVGDIPGGEHKRVGASYRVGEGVDLGGLTAPRWPDRLIFRPPFPPWAARWAFT